MGGGVCRAPIASQTTGCRKHATKCLNRKQLASNLQTSISKHIPWFEVCVCVCVCVCACVCVSKSGTPKTHISNNLIFCCWYTPDFPCRPVSSV
jgi:hypothetical protein